MSNRIAPGKSPEIVFLEAASNGLRLWSIPLLFVVTSTLACGSGSGGATGAAGQPGTAGASGAAGTSGNAGATGSAGTTGAAGATDAGGTTGAAGATGAAGTTGTAGASGTAGSAGTTGTAGTSGGAGTAGAAGTTGVAGTIGTAGTTGTGGATGAAGAGGAAGTGGAMGTAGASGFANPSTYTCNLLFGVSITYDWFTSGFETYVDNAKWEAMVPTTPGMSFVQTWADPNGATWNLPKVSPCTQSSTKPERILLTAVNWTYTTAAQWATTLDAFVKTAQAKYPSVVEIDLMTMLRAPNNMMGGGCTSTEDVVQPYIDDAIRMIVAKYPKLVRATPEVYAPDCTVFTGGGPHLTAAGKPIVAKLYGDVYSKEP